MSGKMSQGLGINRNGLFFPLLFYVPWQRSEAFLPPERRGNSLGCLRGQTERMICIARFQGGAPSTEPKFTLTDKMTFLRLVLPNPNNRANWLLPNTFSERFGEKKAQFSPDNFAFALVLCDYTQEPVQSISASGPAPSRRAL